MTSLKETARALVAPGKGILAADESDRTIRRRFDLLSVESTPETRQAYREMLLTTPGIEEFISAAILFDETFRQRSTEGVPFPCLLASRGIIPGIKVDKGTTGLAFAFGETITEGLDGLRPRLEEYRRLGARFAKWRATYLIGPGKPSDYCSRANAQALARYAALCQETGLVPIVEPEVLMDGGHTIGDCARATERVLHGVFAELYAQRVDPRAMLLKPNMVLAGSHALRQAPVHEVAEETLKILYRQVPPAVPGIVFLSGEQLALAEEPSGELRGGRRCVEDVKWGTQPQRGIVRALSTASRSSTRACVAGITPAPAASAMLIQRSDVRSMRRSGRPSPSAPSRPSFRPEPSPAASWAFA